MYQSSCSELLVDTKIIDVEEAYQYFSKLIEKNDWYSSPEITEELLTTLKEKEGEKITLEKQGEYEQAYDITSPVITLIDKEGHRATIEYGSNGYTTLGFYIEGEGHWDSKAYPIYQEATREGGKIKAFDGGSTRQYEEWNDENYLY